MGMVGNEAYEKKETLINREKHGLSLFGLVIESEIRRKNRSQCWKFAKFAMNLNFCLNQRQQQFLSKLQIK